MALDAIKTMVDTIQNVTPRTPRSACRSRTSAQAEDVVASGYDFTEPLLTSQRKLAPTRCREGHRPA